MTKEKLGLIEENLYLRRQEIEGLIQEVSDETAIELSHRLKTLNKEYLILQEQVGILRYNKTVLDELRAANIQAMPTHNDLYAQPLQQTGSSPSTIVHSAQEQRKQHRHNVQEPHKRDLEKAIGKNVMGVMASVLIFVALIMFAIVALPSMTDSIKILSMFLLSGGITAVGAWLMNKDQKNIFNASIAGCGIGAIFISLMTTRMYFNAINDYVLYITLLLWAAAVAFFSKDKHKVFVVIAEVGISIATFIGLAGLLADSNAANIKASMLIAFALLSEIAIYYFNHRNVMKDDLTMHIPHAIRALIMTIMFLVIAEENIITGIPVIMVLFIGAGLFAINRADGEHGKHFLLTSYVLPIVLIINNYATNLCISNELMEPYAIFISLALVLNGYIFAYNQYKGTVAASQIILTCCAIYFMDEISYHDTMEIMTIILPALLVLIPTIVMSIRTKETYWKWVSANLPIFCSMLWWDIGGLSDTQILLGFLIGIVFYAVNFYTLNEDRDDTLRIYLYIAGMIVIPIQLNDIISCWSSTNETIGAITDNIHLMCAYIPMVAAYLWVDKKECITRVKNITVLQNIIMGVLIITGSFMLYETADVWSYEFGSIAYKTGETFSVLQSWTIGFALIALNAFRTTKMLRAGKGYGVGLSVAYFITLLAIITKMSDVNYVISITLLLFAICLIVAGFKVHIDDITGNKEMRLCGLILSMIVVVKLLMIDVEHNNMLETSGCLLLAGVLCFAISFAYNRLDKTISTERLEENLETFPDIE